MSVKTAATKSWHEEVNAKVAEGKSREDAITAVNKEYPGLRELMLSESKASTPEQTTVPAGTAKARWNEAVASQVASGKSRADAITAADRQHPGLREQMLSESIK